MGVSVAVLAILSITVTVLALGVIAVLRAFFLKWIVTIRILLVPLPRR